MSRMILAASAAGAGLLLSANLALAQTAFEGTWRTDTSRLKLSQRPDVMILKDGVFDCRSCTPPYKVRADGAFHPLAGHPDADETALKIVDNRTAVQTDRKAGRVVSKAVITAAPDGKTVTVAYTDTTNPGAPPVSGKVVERRIDTPVPGAHLASGSWVAEQVGDVTKAGLEQTFKLEGGVLKLSTPTGQSYAARIDGPAAPFKGDPRVTSVTVKKVSDHELIETDLHDGKPVTVLHMTVSPDGRTLTIDFESMRTGAKSQGVATKV